MEEHKGKLIIISGGGTGGPSTAPLALASAYQAIDQSARFIFIGNDPGLEQRLFGSDLAKLKAEYISLPAGKWRRYFDWQNFLDIFKILSAFFRIYFFFRRLRPDLIVSAGSFASVPVVWAGRLAGAKILVHQQDLRPGLANRLMAPVAARLTVTFAKSLSDYKNAVLIGNPSVAGKAAENKRSSLSERFGLLAGRPFLFVTGGGSGALGLNRLLYSALPQLSQDWQIIHITGIGKNGEAPTMENYRALENISHEDFSALLSSADIIISRAGLGALTELSLLAKPAILVPMPGSHQEDNAAYYAEHGAAIVLKEKESSGEILATAVSDLWKHEGLRMKLAANIAAMMPSDGAEKGAKIMAEMLKG